MTLYVIVFFYNYHKYNTQKRDLGRVFGPKIILSHNLFSFTTYQKKKKLISYFLFEKTYNKY